MNATHIYPINDRKEHTTGQSVYCACRPVVERAEDRATYVIHNSYDGREFFEEDDIHLTAHGVYISQ